METAKEKLQQIKAEIKNAETELSKIDARLDSLGLDEDRQRKWEIENQIPSLVTSYAGDEVSLDNVLSLKAELRQIDLKLQDCAGVIDVCRDLRININAKIEKLEKEKISAENDLKTAFLQAQISELQDRFSPSVYATAALQSVIGGYSYNDFLTFQLFPLGPVANLHPYREEAKILITELLASVDDDDGTDDDSIN